MQESQAEIDLRYYSRWEIEAAREQTANGLAFVVGLLFAIVVDSKLDFWLYDIVAFIAGYWWTNYGRSAATEKAWANYENRPILSTYDDGY